LLSALDSFRFTFPDDHWSNIPDELMFLDRVPIDDSMDFDLDEFPNSVDALPTAEGADAIRNLRPRIQTIAKDSASSSLELLGADQRLSRLNLDLSKWLQNRSENSPATATSSNTSVTSEVDVVDQSKLLSDALSYSSEFLAIIHSYSVDGRSSPGGSGNSSSNIPKARRLGIVVILNVVSAYLQLVAIYTKIFQDLSDQPSGNPKSITSALNVLTSLHLTGLNASAGNLQTKIVIHAILHQFETIERLLGLPVEFRVTEKQDEYCSGVFEGAYAHGLLQAIMSGGGAKAHGDTTGDFPMDDWGFKALPSLKDTLQKVQSSLNM
jgi:hypothetical protein